MILNSKRAIFENVFLSVFLIALTQNAVGQAPLEARDQAYLIYQRISGLPPSSAQLDRLETLVKRNKVEEVAAEAMRDPGFYNITLKHMFTPWSHREKSNREPLNDMTTTLIGLVRDHADFREALVGDVVYVRAERRNDTEIYSLDHNLMYLGIERERESLADTNLIVRRYQSAMNLGQVPAGSTAGVFTLQGFADAYYKAGTNRRALEHSLKHFMCYELPELSDSSAPSSMIRRDVDRKPAGSAELFSNTCLGCHAGMDALAGAFANFDYQQTSGTSFKFVFTPTQKTGALTGNNNPEAYYFESQPVPKVNRNPQTHPDGHLVTDDAWTNHWASGPNASKLLFSKFSPRKGHGVRSFARVLAESEGFPRCMAKTVFRQVCLSGSDSIPEKTLASLSFKFKDKNYRMKDLFADVSASCFDTGDR